jgi:putative transposase
MRCTWPSGAVDRPALSSTPIFEWIEAFYNPTRRHSALVYLTPIDYQTLHTAAPAAA